MVAALDRLDGQGRGEVRLAGAHRAEEDDVARSRDPGAAPEVLDASALEAVGTSPVELRERLGRREARGAEAALDGVLGARGDLGIEQRTEEVERRPRFGERLTRQGVGLARERGEFQHAGVSTDRGEDDVAVLHVAHAEACSTRWS